MEMHNIKLDNYKYTMVYLYMTLLLHQTHIFTSIKASFTVNKVGFINVFWHVHFINQAFQLQ